MYRVKSDKQQGPIFPSTELDVCGRVHEAENNEDLVKHDEYTKDTHCPRPSRPENALLISSSCNASWVSMRFGECNEQRNTNNNCRTFRTNVYRMVTIALNNEAFCIRSGRQAPGVHGCRCYVRDIGKYEY